MRLIGDKVVEQCTPLYPYTPQEVTRYEWLRPPTIPDMWDIFLHIGAFLMPYHQWRWVSTSKKGLLSVHMCLSTHTARPREWQVTYYAVRHFRSALLETTQHTGVGVTELELLPALHDRMTHLVETQRPPPQCDHCMCLTYEKPVMEDAVLNTCPSPGFQYLYKFKSVEQGPGPNVPRKTKFREVITYSVHPYPRVGKLIGRCLTQFWKLVLQHLQPRELLKMTDLLGFVRQLVQSQGRGRRHQHCVWVELDLV